MNLQVSWELLTLIGAVVIHGFSSVRSYTRLETKVGTMTEALNKIDKELEKRDNQISAL